MALPTTNLSLNAIHVEVGGTTGTTCSLNDSDIRGIATTDSNYDGGDGINQTSGTTVSIGEFRNASDTPSVTVSPSSSDVLYLWEGATCYAGIRYSSNGIEYINANGGSTTFSNTSRGNWLDSGNADEVWVEVSLDSHSGAGLNWLNSGTGTPRIRCDNSPTYGVLRNSPSGTTTATITASFYDASTGGTLLGTGSSILLRAQYVPAS